MMKILRTPVVPTCLFAIVSFAPDVPGIAQTAATLAPVPMIQPLDVSSGIGLPCVGCTMSTYAAGTSTPLKTYTDSTGTTQNPAVITFNSQGYSPSGIWIGAACYKFVLANSVGATIWSQDNICDQALILKGVLSAGGGSSRLGYVAPGSGTIRTQAQKNADVVSVLDFGADPTGTVDSTANIATAIGSACHAYVPPGTYLISGVTIPDSCDLGGSGPDAVIRLIGNNATGFTLPGGHANVHDLRITKAAGTTGVTGILINAAAVPAIASYDKIFRVRIEGNSSDDLLAAGLTLQSGPQAGCGGGDCGVFYASLEDIDVRYAVNDFLITGTTASLGTNAVSGLNLRGGDSTNCYNIVRGESNRIVNLSCEGDAKGIWIQSDVSANNNNNVFLGYRREANTSDVEVDASSYYNMVQSASLVPANIKDNGVGTTFISSDNLLQLAGGIGYSSVTGYLSLNPFSGIQSAGQSGGYYAFGGRRTADQLRGPSQFEIVAPNTDSAAPLALVGDAIGRGLSLVSQNFSLSGNAGTAIEVNTDGHITATHNGTTNYNPVIVPELQVQSGQASAQTLTYVLGGTASWAPTIANGTMATVDVTVKGCATSALALASYPALTGPAASLTARVRASGTIQVQIRNDSGGTLTPSGMVTAVCIGTQ